MSAEMYRHEGIGMFNGLVVSTMLGCTISYTIPYAMGCVRQEKYKELFVGLLCGIVTIPVGSFVGGLMLRLPIGLLLWDLVPLVLFSAVVACGLIFVSKLTVKLFSWLGLLIRGVITVGLMLGMLEALAGIQLIPGLGKMSEATTICMNAVMVLAGAFPLVFAVTKLLEKPLMKAGKYLGINETAAAGLIASLANSIATFGMLKDMDQRGKIINVAFAVCAAFVLGDHLGFTAGFAPALLPAVIAGKLVGGIAAVGIAMVLTSKKNG
jgi:ethanolamine transporter